MVQIKIIQHHSDVKTDDGSHFVKDRICSLQGLLQVAGERSRHGKADRPQYLTLRPDVIVKLPEGKHLIVDSKMTLIAYEASVSSTTEAEKEKWALAHVESLKRHITELSEKKYHLADQVISPDFVMLFMPLEPAFALAFRMKPELFELAWDRNIAIVSPTTLLATLRTVASLWKQERQQRNALEIAKRGGDLYDKFAGLVKDLETLGERLNSTQKIHSDIMGKISTGRGNLIGQVEKLKELGAKAEKSLPPPNV